MLGLGNSMTTMRLMEGVAPYSNTKSLDGDLSGSNGVNTNYDPQTLLRGSHSFSLWLKPDDGIPASAQTVFGINAAATDFSYLQIATTGKLTMWLYSNGNGIGNISIPSTNSAAFSDGAQSDFTHIAIAVSYTHLTLPTILLV